MTQVDKRNPGMESRQGHPVYRADIDGMRALAVLSVIVYHMIPALLPGGYTGVDVFFVISGFVVAASLASINARSIHAYLAEFYARRLARILPALVWMLILTSIAATLFIPGAWLSDLSDRTGLFAFFGLSNYVMQTNADTYFAPRAEFNPFTHTWSLGVEEQYYLIVPLIFFAWSLSGTHRNRRMPAVVMGLLVLASIFACYWYASHQPTTAFYFVACRFWELGVGAMLFLAGRKFNVQPSQKPGTGIRLADVAAICGVVLLGIAFMSTNENAFPWPGAFIPVIGTALLLVSAEASRLKPLLSSRPMVWVGKRSYSLYLWHWPVFVLMRWTSGLETGWHFVIATFFTLALATFSYSFVEKPLRYSSRIAGWPRGVRICVFLAMPLLGFQLASHLFDNRSNYSLSVVERQHDEWHAGLQMTFPDLGPRRCPAKFAFLGFHGGNRIDYDTSSCPLAKSRPHLYVVGNSHAGMIAPMLDQLAREEGFPISIFTFPGCAVYDLKTRTDSHRAKPCSDFIKTVSNYILEHARPDDILLLPSLRLDRLGNQWDHFSDADIYAQMYSPARLALRKEAVEEARADFMKLTGKGIRVTFMAPTPIFAYPSFRCSDWFNRHNPVCVVRGTQVNFEKLRKPIMDDMMSLSHANALVGVWDPTPALCPESPCRTQVDGHPLFFDGDHLSGYGNYFLYPGFRKYFMELARGPENAS